MQLIRKVNPKRWAERIRRNARRVAEHRSAPAVVFLLELIACAIVPLPNALIMVAMVK